MSDDIHFYEPAHGHGLPHDPFNAIVGPRPIGWISSQDAHGRLNLAPYSFFNAFNYIPPIIGFSSVGRKDSLNNIEQTGEFAWNLATRPLAEQMNQSCAMVAPEVNEFELAGLTPVASKLDCSATGSRKPGVLRVQGHADHSVAARRWRNRAELADSRRSGCRAYRQVAVEGRDLRHRRGRTDSARRRAGGLFPVGA